MDSRHGINLRGCPSDHLLSGREPGARAPFDLFQPFAAYAEQADEIGHRTRAIAPAPGFDAVLMPGDREASTRKNRTRDGIPIPDDTWQTIVDTARSVGITDI